MFDVVHLTVAHPWNDPRIFLKECKSLAAAGYSVALIVPSEMPFSKRVISGVSVLSLPMPHTRWSRILFLPWRALFKALRVPSRIVHFHDPELLWVGFLLSFFGRKVIYDSHENFSKWLRSRRALSSLEKMILPWIARLLESLFVKRFDRCVAATPEIASQFSPAKTFVIQNFPLDCEIGSIENAIPFQNRRSFIFSGVMNSIRGIREIVEAAYHLPEGMDLILAGQIKERDLLRDLQGSPGWPRVRFVGQLSRQELFALMDEAIGGLVTFWPEPNHVEAYPTKLFEYWSRGIPVIASDFPLWRRIIEDADAGLLVDPKSSYAIADAMKILYENQAIRDRLARNALSVITHKFNWKLEEQRLVEIYRDLLSPTIL